MRFCWVPFVLRKTSLPTTKGLTFSPRLPPYKTFTSKGHNPFNSGCVFTEEHSCLRIRRAGPGHQRRHLIAPSDSRDALFLHGAGARHIAECEKWPKLIKKIPPQYPPAARSAHQQGTVILYTVLYDEGTVEKTSVLQSAGDNLDKSAADAVKQWVYSPPACGTVALPTEIEVQVNYELRIE